MPDFSYQYSDWADDELYPTASAQLSRLNKHIAEVSAQMVTDTTAADTSTSTVALQKYHKSLLEERAALKSEAGAGSYDPRQRVKRVRG